LRPTLTVLGSLRWSVSRSCTWWPRGDRRDYFELAQSISCFLGDEEVSYRPLMGAENVTAIIKGREVLGDSWHIEDNLTVFARDRRRQGRLVPLHRDYDSLTG
jgi:hypothetical protein